MGAVGAPSGDPQVKHQNPLDPQRKWTHSRVCGLWQEPRVHADNGELHKPYLPDVSISESHIGLYFLIAIPIT